MATRSCPSPSLPSRMRTRLPTESPMLRPSRRRASSDAKWLRELQLRVLREQLFDPDGIESHRDLQVVVVLFDAHDRSYAKLRVANAHAGANPISGLIFVFVLVGGIPLSHAAAATPLASVRVRAELVVLVVERALIGAGIRWRDSLDEFGRNLLEES